MGIRDLLMKHKNWQDLNSILEKLTQNKYKALLAGGCVRDACLGVVAKDLDLATDATTDEIQKIFPEALGIGKAFGVMMLPLRSGEHIEIASFRSDGQYTDGRHPESISYSTPEEDAKRRDFTVNALFFDPLSDRLIDFVGGCEDLKAKRLRTVGTLTKGFERITFES